MSSQDLLVSVKAIYNYAAAYLHAGILEQRIPKPCRISEAQVGDLLKAAVSAIGGAGSERESPQLKLLLTSLSELADVFDCDGSVRNPVRRREPTWRQTEHQAIDSRRSAYNAACTALDTTDANRAIERILQVRVAPLDADEVATSDLTETDDVLACSRPMCDVLAVLLKLFVAERCCSIGRSTTRRSAGPSDEVSIQRALELIDPVLDRLSYASRDPLMKSWMTHDSSLLSIRPVEIGIALKVHTLDPDIPSGLAERNSQSWKTAFESSSVSGKRVDVPDGNATASH